MANKEFRKGRIITFSSNENYMIVEEGTYFIGLYSLEKDKNYIKDKNVILNVLNEKRYCGSLFNVLKASLNLFDYQTTAKGKKYADKEHIINLEKEFDNEVIATIQGSEKYHTSISLIGDQFEMSCDCPVDGFCKHEYGLIKYLQSDTYLNIKERLSSANFLDLYDKYERLYEYINTGENINFETIKKADFIISLFNALSCKEVGVLFDKLNIDPLKADFTLNAIASSDSVYSKLKKYYDIQNLSYSDSFIKVMALRKEYYEKMMNVLNASSNKNEGLIYCLFNQKFNRNNFYDCRIISDEYCAILAYSFKYNIPDNRYMPKILTALNSSNNLKYALDFIKYKNINTYNSIVVKYSNLIGELGKDVKLSLTDKLNLLNTYKDVDSKLLILEDNYDDAIKENKENLIATELIKLFKIKDYDNNVHFNRVIKIAKKLPNSELLVKVLEGYKDDYRRTGYFYY